MEEPMDPDTPPPLPDTEPCPRCGQPAPVGDYCTACWLMAYNPG